MSNIDQVKDLPPRVQYTASGGQTAFTYPFPIFDEDDIAVEVNEVTLTLATDYTVSGVGDEDGGTITLLSSATAGDIVVLYRDMPLERLIDYQQNGDFLANSVNRDYDRLWLAIQQLQGGVGGGFSLGRAYRAAPGDPVLNGANTVIPDVATRAGKLVDFDQDGAFAYFPPAISVFDGKSFDNVAQMVADPSLQIGQYADTKGYYSAGDGGGNSYLIGTGFGTADGGSVIDLSGSGLQAKGLFVGGISVIRQWGAHGDGVVDDSAALVSANAFGPIVFNEGQYLIDSNVSITEDVRFESGSIIYPSTGSTVSISSSISADDYKIFDGSSGNFSLSNRAVNMRAAWFGVSPEESASNNSTYFDHCVAACPTSNGAKITFPGGLVSTNKLSVSKSGLTVEGHFSGTWLVNNEAADACIEIGGKVSKTSWCTVRNFRIGQSGNVAAANGNCGVRVLATDQTTIEDVVAWNFPDSLYEGYVFDDADNNKLHNLIASNCGNNGWRFTNDSGSSCTDTFGSTLLAYSNGLNGFMFEGSSGFYVNDVHSFGNSQRAFFWSDAKGNNQFYFVSGWIGDTSGEYNWLIQKLNRSSFSNCWAATQQSTLSNTFADGVLINRATVYDVTFNGLICHNNNANGLNITNGSTLIFNACQFTSNGQSGAGSGFRIGGAVEDVTLQGSLSKDNATSGVALTAVASDYLMIQNNNLRNNTGASLSNSSTGVNNQIGTNIV